MGMRLLLLLQATTVWLPLQVACTTRSSARSRASTIQLILLLTSAGQLRTTLGATVMLLHKRTRQVLLMLLLLPMLLLPMLLLLMLLLPMLLLPLLLLLLPLLPMPPMLLPPMLLKPLPSLPSTQPLPLLHNTPLSLSLPLPLPLLQTPQPPRQMLSAAARLQAMAQAQLQRC